jgi:hypothetical protein
MTPAANRLFRQFGQQLSKPYVVLRAQNDKSFAIISLHTSSSRKPRNMIDANHVMEWQKADFLDKNPNGDFILSLQGRANVRRQNAANDPFIAQHQARENAGLEEAPNARRNVSASPLAWLAARCSAEARGDKGGKGVLFHEIEIQAGTRLMQDFDRSNARGRMTMDWSRSTIVDGMGRQNTDANSQGALDASKRLDAALAELGPGLDQIMLAVCCFDQGLEACETFFAMPRRSAKLLIKLGLLRLSVFYGLQSASAAAASFRMR